MGASILPVTLYKNKVLFLFGKERTIDENPGWSDFGGGTDKGETFIQTAIREGGEELTGFLGNDTDIKKLLQAYGTYTLDYNSNTHSTYRCHIFPLEYDSRLPFYYNNNQQFLQKRLDKKVISDTKIFEKTQIKWFSFDEIKKDRNRFRSFYKNIIDLLLQNRLEIETFAKRSLLKNKNKNTMNKKTRNNKTKKK